jgi:BMFP domain-containing protein YqiC
MLTPDWLSRSPDEKADILRQEFDLYHEMERKNLQARADRHAALESRVAALEAALRRIEETAAQMASRLAQIEGNRP